VIIAVDPGKACGLVAIGQRGEYVHRLEGDPFECVKKVEYVLGAVRPLHVVLERYVQQSTKMTVQTDALEVIGAVRYLCKKHNVPVFMQSRSDRVRVTREMLLDLGLWNTRIVSPNGHMNEAARHAVVHIVRHLPHHPIAKKLVGRMVEGVPVLETVTEAIGVNGGLR